MTSPKSRLALDAVNRLTDLAFVEMFGDVAEHSPWLAEYALGIRPFLNREAMITAFRDGLHQARADAQQALIRAHPDLAGKAARAGAVTDDSRNEQSGAGLDRLGDAEFNRFTDLNDRYRQKFGFPFILAVKGAGKAEILAAFEKRLANSVQDEFATALAQICRIMRFRIEERVSVDGSEQS
jgi:2-oxo-4-hydroxy-4-carboxy-5-ureidoimidazoline decarboxylase